ncbi:MAG TPA: MFS transporter [Symbiobacteriaceae bacterium]|nr:MFS transporter [Symbiobacteriaceae bacterium]
MAPQPNRPSFRTFLCLWASQGLSQFGSSLSFFAISVWLVTDLYPAPEQKAALAATLSYVSLAFAIPSLALAPIAGVFADRYDKKRIMLLMDLGAALVAGLMAYLIWTEQFSIHLLLPLIAAHAAMAAFHGAAFDTAYPLLVDEAHLPRANGMMQLLGSSSAILVPAVAAGLIALTSTAFVLLLDLISFLVAVVVLAVLAVPRAEPAAVQPSKATPSLWLEVKVGMQFLLERRELLWLLSMFAGANLLMAPLGIYLPLITKFTLATDWGARGFTFQGAFALLDTLFALGSVAGGLFIASWGGLKGRRVWGVIVPLLAGGLMMIGLGLSHSLYLSAGVLFCFSFGNPVANAHSQAIWQSRTPREKQGRVFAVRRVIAQVTSPLMVAISGWLAGRVDPAFIILLFGLLLTAWATLQAFNRRIHAVDLPPAPLPVGAPVEGPAS